MSTIKCEVEINEELLAAAQKILATAALNDTPSMQRCRATEQHRGRRSVLLRLIEMVHPGVRLPDGVGSGRILNTAGSLPRRMLRSGGLELRRMNRPDGDSLDPVDRLARFLAGDELVSTNRESCRDMESIKSGETGLGCDPQGILEEPSSKRGPVLDALEELFVEGSLVYLPVKDCFWQNLETNKSAGGEGTPRIIQDGQSIQ